MIPLSDQTKRSFQTLLRVAEEGDLVLLSCRETPSEEPVPTICASYVDRDGMECFVPLARLYDNDPRDRLVPPSEGEVKANGHSQEQPPRAEG